MNKKSLHYLDEDKWKLLWSRDITEENIPKFPKITKWQKFKVMLSNWKFNRYIKKRIRNGYINGVGEPLKCDSCGCTDLEQYDECYGDGNYILEEYKVRCSKCKKHLGYNSYGNWSL